MARPRPPVMLACGHFVTFGTACGICAEREAAAKFAAATPPPPPVKVRPGSGPDPTRAPRGDAPRGATVNTPGSATEKHLGDQPTAGMYNLPDPVYYADPLRAYGTESLSATSARLLLPPSTPAHYRWAIDHPLTGRTPAMMFGAAVHALALGTADLAVFDEGRSWNSKAGERFLAEHPDHGDRLPILAHEVPAAEAMADALLAHPVARLGLTGGHAEQAMFAEDDRFGVWRRCKVDYLAPAAGDRLIMIDIKTTDNASPQAFARSAAKFGYHRQADNCAWLARSLDLAKHVSMIFAAVEKHPPYLVAVYECDPADLRRAAELNDAACGVFARCLATGEWPGYPETITRLHMPVWTARDEEDALAATEEGTTE